MSRLNRVFGKVLVFLVAALAYIEGNGNPLRKQFDVDGGDE